MLHDITGVVARAPVPVVARSKAWVCGRSPAENVGSKSAVSSGVERTCIVKCSERLVSEL